MGCLTATVLFFLAFPAYPAIRLGQPQSASGEIDLNRIPNPGTTVYLKIRPAAWRLFNPVKNNDRPVKNQTATRILQSLTDSVDPTMGAILKLCFAPVVEEFLVAKWPSRFTWEVEQPVWMIGLELVNPGDVDLLMNDISAISNSSQGVMSERKLRGFPLTSLILPNRQIHFLRGEHHLLISPNLFLIQGYLESLDSPPEPPSAKKPDALIGWRLDPPDKQVENSSTKPVDHLYTHLGFDRIEVSFQALPVGLEVRLKAKRLFPLNRSAPFRPINTELLDSIPSRSDLIIAGGGLDLFPETQERTSTLDRPYAFGVEVPEGKGNLPETWRVGGAVERKVAVAKAPSPVSEEITQRLGGILDHLGQLGKDLNTLVVEDRILFGDITRSSSRPPESEQLKEHFSELAREAILAGVVSPGLLVLPLHWGIQLQEEGKDIHDTWLPEDWNKEVAPIEFSLGCPPDGYEIRLLSPSPTSFILLLADLLFFLHLDYSGEWESLFSLWHSGMSPASDVVPQ